MKKYFFIIFITFSINGFTQDFEKDTFQTTLGELEITFIGHGSLMFSIDDKIIHIDPSSREANCQKLI
jgi:hypothetical protein